MYIYPPRPKNRIKPRQLPDYEKSGLWLAQRKYNGDRSLVQVSGQNLKLWNRHGREQDYRIHPELRDAILRLKLPPGENWLDGELLHRRAPDTLVLFDMLKYDGKYLIGKSQTERLDMLSHVCGDSLDAHPILGYSPAPQTNSPKLYLAENWCDGFVERFNESLPTTLSEGLVLRKRASVLDNFGASEYEVDWQVRCRKFNKNYRY